MLFISFSSLMGEKFPLLHCSNFNCKRIKINNHKITKLGLDEIQ
jgi:hypothetical protein